MAGIHASGEDYLEAILVLGQKNKGEVRSIDVSRELEVTKPSVSNAMKILKNGGFILIDGDGYITLTEEGRAIALKIYEKHRVLSLWLQDMGVSEEVAAEDACKIEHVISDESFNCLKEHLKSSHELDIIE
ncbi:MAG: metal-dependent transcriptional regulator [Ruminococcus sp.]|nr:metal-dependent transcriptional regulator [Ruminococcus sp.]MBQ7070763.1 metal-dependent transcriptional regulator [Ruminococcus sp.]